MSRKAKPLAEQLPNPEPHPPWEDFPWDRPEWEEPDLDKVGPIGAVKGLLVWFRLDADWFRRAEAVACGHHPWNETSHSMLNLIRSRFNQSIELVLDRWRRWLPNDAEPALPTQVHWSNEAFRAVGAYHRRLQALIRRQEANLDKIQKALIKIKSKPQPPPLSERACAVLTPAQAIIFEVLWERRLVGYDALLDTPGAFQVGVTDEAVTKSS